ncbi:MAG TPA: WXG100 family type VII secretion target [Actinocatenispora sp.]
MGTDFSQYSHQQLVAMLYAGDPKTVRGAGSTWDTTGGALHDRANDLDKQLHSFTDKWSGGAAQQYHTMIKDLAKGIRKVADTAYDVRDLTYSSAEALEDARRTMPQPVSVPDLSPSTVQLATTPLSLDPTLSQDVVQALATKQNDAVKAVQQHQAAAQAADGAHQQAVQVMTQLAGHYTAAESAMPATPDAAPPPSVPQDTSTAAPTTLPALNTSLTPVSDTGVPTTLPVLVGAGAVAAGTSPLFGRMFQAGLAAASAASAGRFGGVLPKLPGFMRRDKDKTGKTPKTGALSGAGGAGGGGGGDFGGGGGGTGEDPSASPTLSGGSPTGAAASLGTAGAAAAGATAGKGMGMMPMMPMGAAMGAGDMGAGRRIPPWLVETENVWGETAIVAPPVIGEEQV